MTRPQVALGDSHNFGRRVSLVDGRVRKPRTVYWEWLLLSAESPLRKALDEAASKSPLGKGAFGFLPDLAFSGERERGGGEVERVDLAPLPDPTPEGRRGLAVVVGRALALFSWLGLADLHWENLALGLNREGQTVFAPLDVEMILADLSLPTETKLIPDADPEYAAVVQHACGVRRALPFLGKPIDGGDLVAMAEAYRSTLAFLEKSSAALAEVFANLPALAETPIRVLLRGTEEYVDPQASLWPPLLEAEKEQLARGDIPYFFRLYGQPGIHYYGDPALTEVKTLPAEGDVPQLDPMLSLAKGLKSRTRKSLREEGLLTVLGAFDHPSIKGTHSAGDLEVTFSKRTLVVKPKKGEELTAHRDLSEFVGSVYLPCRCGEVREALVPPVTRCSSDGAATRFPGP